MDRASSTINQNHNTQSEPSNHTAASPEQSATERSTTERSATDKSTTEQSVTEVDAIVRCQQEVVTLTEKLFRVSADFENFKKRTEREKANWIKMTQANVLHDLLGIVDDFDRALQEAHKNPASEDFSIWLKGFDLTAKTLTKLLNKYDVQEIKDNEIFNPQYHEAVMHVDSSEHISGAIVAVLQKGYTYRGEVLRPAKVSVAQ